MPGRPKKLDTNCSGMTDGGLIPVRYGMPLMSKAMDERRSGTLYLYEVEGAIPYVISIHYPTQVPPQHGIIIREAASRLRANIDETLKRVDSKEAISHHREDAHYEVLREESGEARGSVHYMATSADSSETAKGMQIRDGLTILIGTAQNLRDTYLEVAKEWNTHKRMESTHGADAVPRVLGRRLVTEAYILTDGIDRLYYDLTHHAVGKISGAVGDYHPMTAAGIDGPMIEEECCKMWNLRPVVSEQDPPREHIAYVMNDAAILSRGVASTMKWVKYLKNTARRELLEPPDDGTKGSSAMPHKVGNPSVEERDIGLSAYKVAQIAAGMTQSVNREDARNLEASATDRIDIPHVFIVTDYMCALAKNVLQRCVPQPANLKAGLWRVQGAVTSENIRYQLIMKGMPEKDARKKAEDTAKKAIAENRHYELVLLEDSEVRKFLTAEEITDFSDPEKYIGESARTVDRAYEKLYGKNVL